MAIAEIVVRQPEFFGSEEQGNRRRREMLANQAAAVFNRPQWMLQFTMPERCGAHYQSAVGNRVGECLEFLGVPKNFLSVHGGTRFLIGNIVWIDESQVLEAEVGHGSRGRADVQRVSAANQNRSPIVCHSGSVGR